MKQQTIQVTVDIVVFTVHEETLQVLLSAAEVLTTDLQLMATVLQSHHRGGEAAAAGVGYAGGAV